MTLKTKNKSRIYLTYLNESNDKITLSFRDETSLTEHLNKSKISYLNIISISRDNPNLTKSGKISSGISNFVSYRHTTKRGVGN